MKIFHLFNNILKSKSRKQIESYFDWLLEYGFKKKYGIYATEKCLAYENSECMVSIFWTVPEGSPTIKLVKSKANIDLSYLNKKLMETNNFYSENPLKQRYWIFNVLDRDVYLRIYADEVFRLISHRGN